MVYNSSTDPWFQYFNSDGPQWLLLFAVYGTRALWATLALLFNLAIVYITVKSKTLRGSCNILIAMESGFEVLLDLGYYVSFLVVLSRMKFIRYEHCFWALIVPCLCGDMAQLTMVVTGVDRLCCVLFPFWYKKRNAKRYLAFIWALLYCYSIYDFIINYIDYGNSKDFMVSCSTHEMGNSGMGILMRINGLTLSGTLMVVYSLCWFLVFQLSASAKSVNTDNRKLIKALSFIIALNLTGVFLKCSVNLLFQTVLPVNAFFKTAFAIAFSFLTIAVYGANAPVLFIISNEYHKRFIQHFPWLMNRCCQSDRVSTHCSIASSTVTVISDNGSPKEQRGGTKGTLFVQMIHQKAATD